jgi:hypothetical protein
MLKMTRYLIKWTGDPRCADYYERATFNGVLGTQNPATGMLIYYMPLATGRVKQFGTPNDTFWCCYGTGIEAFAKPGEAIYFHDRPSTELGTAVPRSGGAALSLSKGRDGIYVNLFVASRVNWAARGVRLEQATRFPEEEGTTFTVRAKSPTAFALHIRVPWWADRGVQVKLNGKRLALRAKPSSYLTIKRRWRDGDRVEMAMPMGLHAEPMPDDRETMALMYGPLVLAGLTTTDTYFLADATLRSSGATSLRSTSAKDLKSWVKPVEGKPLTFRTVRQASDLTLVPLYKVMDEPYGVYWVVTRKGSARHREILAQEEARRKFEARVVDRVVPLDAQSEQAHNLQGFATGAGPFAGKAWRHATGGGWWSWDVKALPDAPVILACTYWGDDVGARTFDVLVDGQVIATQSLNRNKPGEFFVVEYPIPGELTAGKDRITVRFQAHEGNFAGGVFECLVLRSEVGR